jgi:hypothetical protein
MKLAIIPEIRIYADGVGLTGAEISKVLEQHAGSLASIAAKSIQEIEQYTFAPSEPIHLRFFKNANVPLSPAIMVGQEPNQMFFESPIDFYSRYVQVPYEELYRAKKGTAEEKAKYVETLKEQHKVSEIEMTGDFVRVFSDPMSLSCFIKVRE